jgi:chromosome segregation ATPase
MQALNYPLQQLLIIKNKRFEQALKTLEEKTAILHKEEEVLRKKEQERDEVLEHKKAKLQQIRKALDEGIAPAKIQQMKVYMDVVKEKLKEKEKLVLQQKDKVQIAKKQCDEARANMFQKKKDLEKLQIHKKAWEKEVHNWTIKEEANIEDEMSSMRHAIKKQKEKKEK